MRCAAINAAAAGQVILRARDDSLGHQSFHLGTIIFNDWRGSHLTHDVMERTAQGEGEMAGGDLRNF